MAGADEDVESPPPQRALAHPLFHGHAPVGILTAENPRHPAEIKDNEELRGHLDRMGLKYEGPTPGQYDDHENSFIVHGPTREQMRELGKKSGQESVIYTHGKNHEMHFVNGVSDGSYVAGDTSHPVSHFLTRPSNYWTALPGTNSFVRLNFDPKWTMRPSSSAGQPQPQSSPHQGSLGKTMSTKRYSLSDLSKAIAERLHKAEAEFKALAGQELLLRKDEHMEPGVHEAPAAGVASHQEPGGHEKFDMGMPDSLPDSPVGSATGLPPGQLQDPASQAGPTQVDPQGDMAGVERCITCGQQDLPGSCTCLAQPLAMSEKTKEASAVRNASSGKPWLKAELCKGCGKSHTEKACAMAKEEDFVNVDGKKSTKGVAAKAKLPKTDDDLGPGMSGPASKEMSAGGSGGEIKKGKLGKADPLATAKPKPPVKKPKPVVMEASPDAERKAEASASASASMVKAALPPMAKPPGGGIKAAAPTAKVGAPKVAGVPSAPPLGKAALPAAGAQMAQHAQVAGSKAAAQGAAAPKAAAPTPMPTPSQHAGRAAEHQAAMGGAFQPKGPVVSGLELAPKKPAGMAAPAAKPGMGKTSAAPYAHILGKSEGRDLGQCLLCGKTEHGGSCR